MLHGVAFAGIGSIVVKRGPNPLLLTLAFIYLVAALPLLALTKRTLVREPDAHSFALFVSQLGLLIFWILSLCFLTMMAAIFVAVAR